MDNWKSLAEELKHAPQHEAFRLWLRDCCGYRAQDLDEGDIVEAYTHFINELDDLAEQEEPQTTAQDDGIVEAYRKATPEQQLAVLQLLGLKQRRTLNNF